MLPIFEIGVFVILTVFIAVLLREYLRLHSQHEKLLKERMDVEYRARQRAVQLVEEARTKAEEILQKAAAHAFSQERDISADLQAISLEQENMYKQILQSISKSIEDQAVREFAEIKSSITADSLTSKKEIMARLDEDYKRALEEVDKYKEEKLREIKEHLPEIVEDISRNLLGQSMTTDHHVQLAETLLAQARQKYGL